MIKPYSLDNHVHFLPSVFSRFLCVFVTGIPCTFYTLFDLQTWRHTFDVCIQLEPVSSMYPVIFQLLKEVNNSPCPLRHTLTPPVTESRYIHDWRRRRYEFMSTIDSCHWVLLYVINIFSESTGTSKIMLFRIQAKVSRSHSVYGKVCKYLIRTLYVVIYHTTAYQK